MFWKKSPLKKLEKKYDRLIQEAYDLSKTDRKQADLKQAEAEEVLKKIKIMEQEK